MQKPAKVQKALYVSDGINIQKLLRGLENLLRKTQ